LAGILAGGPSALILGDNIFYGDNLRALLLTRPARPRRHGCSPAWVDDPERTG